MKILLVSKTFTPITHGPAKFAHLLLKINEYYPQHEVRILTEGIDKPIPNKVYKMKSRTYAPLGSLWILFDNFTYYSALKKYCGEYDFDIVLVNNAIQGSWIKMMLPQHIKVLGMLNDDDYLSESLATFKWKKKWWINFPRKFLEKLAVHTLNGIITNSTYLQNAVINTYRANKKNIYHLYKAIEASTIPNKKNLSTISPIKVLFVKSDYPRGGLFTLIKALSTLTDYQFQLTIIGPPLTEKENIISKISYAPTNLNLVFTGPLPQKKVFDSFNTHDIFCVPSLKEALGVANIEALANGIPVISSNAGGIPEVLDYGNNGWLSKAGDTQSLATAFKECIENKDLRLAKSEAGKAFVRKHFEYKEMLKKFINILETIYNNN